MLLLPPSTPLLRTGPWDEAPRLPSTESFQTHLAGLHLLRRHVINTILPMVLESRYRPCKRPRVVRDARAQRLGQWLPPRDASPSLLLPRFVLSQLGAAAGLGWHAETLMNAAKKLTPIKAEAGRLRDRGFRVEGCWITADHEDEEIRPLPGDLYCLVDGDEITGRVSHVGVIVDSRPNLESEWITADAGLGQPEQFALYCRRRHDAKQGTLSRPRFRGPLAMLNDQSKPRTLAGWLSLELVDVSAEVLERVKA